MQLFIPNTTHSTALPLFAHAVQAGFPSPADDYVQGKLSLDEYLIQHQAATFFARAQGDSMIGAGIFDGDLLVVDRALNATSGSIVIAIINGELTIKRLIKQPHSIILHAENPAYPDLTFQEGQEVQIWGVVTATIKKLA